MPDSVGLSAYRIVQEAVTNTVRHAGRGASCSVHLQWSGDRLTVDVRDHADLAGRPRYLTARLAR